MRDFLKILLLPPVVLFLGMAIGYLAHRRSHRAGLPLMAGTILALFVLCLPLATGGLMGLAQWGVRPLEAGQVSKAEAIVILSAGLDERVPEFGGVTSVDTMTLARLRYGARLHRETHLPILVTGGEWGKRKTVLADAMVESLQSDFLVKTRWVERLAENTRGNAEGSAEILLADDIHNVLLVTHAWHMPRAARAFERAGLTVIPAPTGFERSAGLSPRDFVPSAVSFHTNYYALHELVGRAWYRITG